MLSRFRIVEHAPDPAPSTASDDTGIDKPRRPRTRPRTEIVLIAVIAVLGVALTAVLAFRWGASTSEDGAVAARPAPSPSGEQSLTVAEIYATLAPSVVSIRAKGTGRAASTASGTGLVANADGTILTAYHVVKGATAIEVTFADGTTSPATVAAAEPKTDIATLTPAKLPTVLVPAVLGGGAAVGDMVVAIGDQLGLTRSTTTGVVSGLDRGVTTKDVGDLSGLIQFDAAVNPGSSGGPLVNARGETVGIVVALANPTDAGTFVGVGFAVPIGTAVGGDGPPPQL